MVGIVVEENKFFGAAFHDDVDGFAPVAVSPALFAGGVFFGEVLGVVNEQVGAFSQLANAFIEDRIARLVVRGVNNDLALGFHAEAQAALRMIEPLGVYGAMIERGAAFVDIGELAVRGHLTHVHREIGIGHLFFQRLLQAAGAAGGVEDERVVAVVIERREKWDALDVVPVEVGKKNVRVDGMAVLPVYSLFQGQLFAQVAKSSAAVKYVNVPVDAHLNTGGIATVTQVF